MTKGQNSAYLRLHRIPTSPSRYVFFMQVFCLLLGAIAVLICALVSWMKLFILLILLWYFVFSLKVYRRELSLAEDRYLLLNDKDEWGLSEQNAVPQQLVLQPHVLILPFMILLPFRAQKRTYTFIFCRDNLDAELGRILRVRLLHPVVSKHPLKRND